MDLQFKTIHPAKYLRDHLASNVRPDGREFLDFRPISINVSSITQADSSAVFKIGNTTVVCGIKAELACPKVEFPDSGYIVPNVDLTPLSSPKFRPGPPSEEAQCISKLTERILDSSNAVNLKDLCIYKNKLAWVLYCDIICVDYDGSVIDACLGALMAALKVLKLPKVEYTAETESIRVLTEDKVQFPINNIAISSTMAIYDDNLLIVDPINDEEELALSTITVVLNGNDICFIHKSGGVPVPNHLLIKILSKAKSHSNQIRKLILAAIEK